MTDVSVSLEGFSDVRIVPEIFDLEKNMRQIVIIEIKVREDMEPGKYDLTLKAISKKSIDERKIPLNVLKKPEKITIETEKDGLANEIRDLRGLIDKVWGETVNAQLEEKEVIHVFNTLSEARGSVSMAEGYLNINKINETRIFIESGKTSAQNAVIALSMAKLFAPLCPIINSSFMNICTAYWGVFAIPIAAILIFILEMKNMERAYNREREEEFRMIRDVIEEESEEFRMIREMIEGKELPKDKNIISNKEFIKKDNNLR